MYSLFLGIQFVVTSWFKSIWHFVKKRSWSSHWRWGHPVAAKRFFFFKRSTGFWAEAPMKTFFTFQKCPPGGLLFLKARRGKKTKSAFLAFFCQKKEEKKGDKNTQKGVFMQPKKPDIGYMDHLFPYMPTYWFAWKISNKKLEIWFKLIPIQEKMFFFNVGGHEMIF